MRLEGKVAIVVGGGQQPGQTMGNGRAVCLRFAEEGAKVLVVDWEESLAAETVRLIEEKGGTASACVANITSEDDCKAIAATCMDRYGRIDILHNNVGRSRGDAGTTEMDADVWDELMSINLKGMFMTCKHVLPIMRAQKSGNIINISSIASLCTRMTLTYKTSKAGVNSMTHHMALENAEHGIRVNAILPGLMDTPMAIERRAAERNVDRDVVRQERDDRVPLRRKMGDAWDVANAAVFLASDEARFITSVMLPVDGGLSSQIG